MGKQIEPDDRTRTAPQSPGAADEPSHMQERRRIIQEYANSLREVLKRLQTGACPS